MEVDDFYQLRSSVLVINKKITADNDILWDYWDYFASAQKHLS